MTGKIERRSSPPLPQVQKQEKTPAAADAQAAVAPPSSAWSDKRPSAARETPTTPPPSQSTEALWGPKQPNPQVAAIREAMAKQPVDELAKTLAKASKESPQAYRSALRDTLEEHLHDASKLQRHLTLLDINGDGDVTMKENYKSLRQLGMSPGKAILVGGASQLALIFSTRDSIGLSIPIKHADKGQHESVHTGGMDPEQDLTKKLDEMMAEDLNGDGFVDLNEIGHLLDKRAEASSAGKIAKTLVKAANKAEFAALFALTGGKMNRDDLKDFYMGSLFFSLLKPDALAQRLVLLREK